MEKVFRSVVVRNLLGLLALLGVHYVSDRYYLQQRMGMNQLLPYLFLLGLYGWLVFHNRVLFERFYLQQRKRQYIRWTLLIMSLNTLSMYGFLTLQFQVTHPLPPILSFWVHTLAGFGIYAFYRSTLGIPTPLKSNLPKVIPPVDSGEFICTVDGEKQMIPYEEIRYLESLENYVKVVTPRKTHVTRLTMKEAEERLPKPTFVRISRSHLINTSHVEMLEADSITVSGKSLKIGKVYKRYVSEFLTETGVS
ncbi:LytTR family DNA-binding domain-containing protein [Siphonobacter sp. SORGH_AS_1065]|uniref:LytR/AlgR family response regulator transcription factor n=1 Tax=Siphonobacter sp. SORGH_AS_1065 TaxID=3041795 RepID=UPI002784E043|nr:LytTR family DNA-binding domain-containing protein [Siphonobacter sp. SORGH_AS_1065]MDQ1088352.1 hypothetical protein [Siphonobacter sp. SORGH_AS_1065]